MSAILKNFTVLSIGTVLLVGVFAYGIKYGFLPAVILLLQESVRLMLIPIAPAPANDSEVAHSTSRHVH